MQLSEIINSSSVLPNLKASSKRQLLQELANEGARITGIEAQVIFETLLRREKLGSTGLGEGIAIPHGKFPSLDRVHGVFARLAPPVKFESVDDNPVDLVFLLLAPESAGADHLKALARISRLLRDETMCNKLRGTDKNEALYALLTDTSARAA